MTETPETAVDIARAQVRAEAEAVAAIAQQIDDTFLSVARMLLQAEGKLVVSGVGTSGFVARRAAHLFSLLGTPAVYLSPVDALHGSLGALQASDILLVISRGGASDEINSLVELAGHDGVVTIALTHSPQCPLADLVDVHIPLERVDDPADPAQIVAMGSTLAEGAWLDSLALVLMRARGTDWTQVRRIHPGGEVGRLSEVPQPPNRVSISETDV